MRHRDLYQNPGTQVAVRKQKIILVSTYRALFEAVYPKTACTCIQNPTYPEKLSWKGRGPV